MKDFCLFTCSDQFQFPRKGLEFVRVIHILCQQLGIKLTHFGYVLEEESGTELPNEGRFDSDGRDRLNQVLAEKPTVSIGLWSDSNEHPYYDLQAELINTGRADGYAFIYIQFPMQHISNLTSSTLVSFVNWLLSVLNHIGQLDYALITTMKPALPSTYFRNIFTSNLSDDEALNLAIWERKLDERKTKLRGLYWGNLLGPGHLSQLTDKQAFIEHLVTLVGIQRLLFMNNSALFFMLPSPDLTTDSVADSVESLLKRNNLLMQPDDQAKERVKRSFALSRPGKQ